MAFGNYKTSPENVEQAGEKMFQVRLFSFNNHKIAIEAKQRNAKVT